MNLVTLIVTLVITFSFDWFLFIDLIRYVILIEWASLIFAQLEQQFHLDRWNQFSDIQFRCNLNLIDSTLVQFKRSVPIPN